MNKIIKFAISAVLVIVLFIIATMFHKVDATQAGIISDTTQVLKVANKTAIGYYIAFMLVASLSAAFSRYSKIDIPFAIISWCLALIRFVAGFAMISGGANIYVFESRLGAWFQLLVPILMIVWQFMLRPSKKKHNNHVQQQPVNNAGYNNYNGNR